MDTVEKIYPTEEELSIVNKISTCPYCQNTFKSESNLNLHLIKTHKQTNLLNNYNVKKLYFCPIGNCSYNKTTNFRLFKQIKQHYLKVHSSKNHICTNCNKGFSTEQFLKNHIDYCNIWFKCCDCNMSYNCYETLKTHCRRKKHKILEKIAYKNHINNTSNRNRLCIEKTNNIPRLILPKPIKYELISIQTVEKSSQTDQNILQISQETQTIYEQNRDIQTVETQTITPKTVSCNTPLDFNDIDDVLKINEVGTQTHNIILSSSSSSSSSCNGNNDDDILSQTLDSNYFNCNMETQTDLIFSDELFKCCDDYTNMYTQTCAELFLNNNNNNNNNTNNCVVVDDVDDVLELTNSQTQTSVFDAVLKSVESQTIMSQSKSLTLNCKDISHMETQTEMHFKQMLEEINA